MVVADEGGDPFILSRSTGKISLAMHGTGVWEPHDIFPDIRTMTACLAAMGALVVSAGDDFTDDECDIRPEHRETALQRLGELLDSASAAREALGRLGWLPDWGEDPEDLSHH